MLRKREIVFLHAFTAPIQSEIMHVVQAASIVDLSAGDGSRALLAITKGCT
jgi:hypothetical protein